MVLSVGDGGQLPHTVLAEQLVQRGDGVLLLHLIQTAMDQIDVFLPVGDSLLLHRLAQIGVGGVGIGVIRNFLRRVGQLIIHRDLTLHRIAGFFHTGEFFVKLDPKGCEGVERTAQLSHTIVGIAIGIPGQFKTVKDALGLTAQPHALHFVRVGEDGYAGDVMRLIAGVNGYHIIPKQIAEGFVLHENLCRQQDGAFILHRLKGDLSGQRKAVVRGVHHPNGMLTQSGGGINLHLIISLLCLRSTGIQQSFSLIQFQYTLLYAGDADLRGDTVGAQIASGDPPLHLHRHKVIRDDNAVALSQVGRTVICVRGILPNIRGIGDRVHRQGESKLSHIVHFHLGQISGEPQNAGSLVKLGIAQ